MKKKILTSVILLSVVPFVAFAQAAGAIDTSWIDSLINNVIGVLNNLVPLFIALAVAFFLWGVLQFVSSGDDEEKRKLARARMIHGVIAIFIMVSLWGLIGVLANVFNLGTTVIIPPIVPTP